MHRGTNLYYLWSKKKKKKKKLGQMVEPRINLQVVVSSVTNAHQVVQAGCR